MAKLRCMKCPRFDIIKKTFLTRRCLTEKLRPKIHFRTYKRRYHLEYSVEVVPGESEAPIKSVLYYDDSSWVCQVKVFIKL